MLVVLFASQYSSDSQVKRVLLEQFTGSWCGWCVDGSYVMELLEEDYPDTFIGCKIHNGDSWLLQKKELSEDPWVLPDFLCEQLTDVLMEVLSD